MRVAPKTHGLHLLITILFEPPAEADITGYDREHFLTYARLIDAERAGQDWKVAASEILLCDVEADPEKTQHCWRSHLERAHWILSSAKVSNSPS